MFHQHRSLRKIVELAALSQIVPPTHSETLLILRHRNADDIVLDLEDREQFLRELQYFLAELECDLMNVARVVRDDRAIIPLYSCVSFILKFATIGFLRVNYG